VTHVFQGVEPDRVTTPALETGERTIGEIASSVFVPVRKHHRIMGSMSGGTSFGASTDSYYDFTLGGPMRLRAYDLGEFSGVNFLLGTVAYLHNVGRLPDFLGGPIYLAGAVETGSTFTQLSAARMRTDFSAGLVLDTLLGPLSFTAAGSVDGHYHVYLSIGRVFR
jgi:NTE family protein